MVSVLWVYWYPIKQNRAAFLLSTFLLGITIDMFSDTLAMNAAALITIAYLRPTMMRFVFGISYEFQNFKLGNTTTAQQMTFLALLIVVHHLFYFTLEVFSFSNVLLIFKKVVSVGAVTFIICALLGSLFSTEKE